MSNKNFTTSILVDQTPNEVFNAVNNVRAWWDGEIEGDTDKLNGEFIYRYGEIHTSKQKIVEMVPERKVVWLVTEGKINFVKDKEEWIGTKIYFEISAKGDKTLLTFTHEGLVPQIECYKDCSNAWTQLVRQSLLDLITTGKGKKIF